MKRIFGHIFTGIACGAALFLAGANPAVAQVASAGSPAALGANDEVDWAQTGPAGDEFGWYYGDPQPISVNVASALSLGATVSSKNLSRVDQGNGWNGFFAPGTALLWNQNSYAVSSGGITGNVIQGGNDITVHFASPVNAAGAQMEADLGFPFTCSVTAYDSQGNLLGSFSVGSAGNKAAFIGITSATNNISTVVFHAIANGFDASNMALGPVFVNDTSYLPAISAQPQSVVVSNPADTAFAVVAAPSISALNYQWFFNGSSLNGATNCALNIPHASYPNQGTYQVSVSNSFGSVTSRVATLTLAPAPTTTLGITLLNGLPLLFWQATTTNYNLQMSTDLTSANWTTVTNGVPYAVTNAPNGNAPVTASNGISSFGVLITNAPGTAFFRLH
jgi:hypothetical protein